MTTVTLREHSKVPSEPLKLSQKDLDWIINENNDEEKVHNQKKLEIDVKLFLKSLDEAIRSLS